MRFVVSSMVLLSVLVTALVSVRLHAEVMRLRYRVEEKAAERRALERELRLATVDLEKVKAPYWQLKAKDAARAGLARSAGSRSPAPSAEPGAPAADEATNADAAGEDPR